MYHSLSYTPFDWDRLDLDLLVHRQLIPYHHPVSSYRIIIPHHYLVSSSWIIISYHHLISSPGKGWLVAVKDQRGNVSIHQCRSQLHELRVQRIPVCQHQAAGIRADIRADIRVSPLTQSVTPSVSVDFHALLVARLDGRSSVCRNINKEAACC